MFQNCIESFVQQAQARPQSMALHIPLQEEVTFAELIKNAARVQSHLIPYGIEPGTYVLLLDGLGSRLYAVMTALMSLGATVMVVEPWMSVERIQQIIQLARPKLFIAHSPGFLWGLRVPEIRKIPHWIRASSLMTGKYQNTLTVEKVDPQTTGILTFTSGTMGAPKGVVRSQGYLLKQHEVLSRHLESARFAGPDLCIFANFVMTNLASGRGSILIPSAWKAKALRAIDELPPKHQPETLTSGPAFLLTLMKNAQVNSLKSIHVGGALTDCAIFEKGFQTWPQAHWSHIYGGSEAEPVALADARQAVQESQKEGYFQTLYLGKNIPEIQADLQSQGLWVAGPHVCPEYFGNEKENQLNKRKDAHGVQWHFMGDKIKADATGWWYQGRASQSSEDFQTEQRVYQVLQSSQSFILSEKVNDKKDTEASPRKWLIGEGVAHRSKELLKLFPQLHSVREAPIYRDRRHRARIDRVKTLQKGASWLVG